MRKFRDFTPLRRIVPTKKPRTDWTLHKTDLQEDFNNHCGYCDSYDGYKHTYFEVDHFVPKDLIKKNNWKISLTQYSNLVYSCKFCNNFKLNNWPSNSPTRFYKNKKGFIDPCNIKYNEHFYRTPNGAIRGKTVLGKWMCSKAFKFNERERSIIVLWNMNRLRKIIDALIVILNTHKINSQKYKFIKSKLGGFTLEYYIFHKELIDYYD
jgi:hypothetical protein